MPSSSERSCFLPFTAASDLTSGLRLYAAIGGGPPHVFEVDTGSVGVLVPRNRLGPPYQNFDPCWTSNLDTSAAAKLIAASGSKRRSFWACRRHGTTASRRLSDDRGRGFRSRPAE